MKSNEEVIKYLNELRKQQKISISELARKVDMSKSTVSQYFNGKLQFPLNRAHDFARVLGVTTDDLLGLDLSKVNPVNGLTKIPLLGTIACGDPILADENIAGYLSEPTDFLPSGKLFYLRAKGQSMDPTIKDGSLVLIRQQPDVEDGEIAAILFVDDDEATLKRIKRAGPTVILMPDNLKYDPIVVDQDHPARILGKAVRVTTNL
ncbi:LexA family protein [Limosilactobacillus fermentum]|uniref:Repressor n=2 Tax=Bacillati TaxID=1783272 RepID=A0A829LX07_LIMFE|nr:XRE family transcriptional regulator [Limosilactobacillus fermentum]ESS00516.1 repressor [Limosilactobacillus fermentum NB-22]MCH5396483.1 helix-turn-helix domain-containing protein [Limosilactobacillus fermentum]NHD43644.1 helix-turn-helix domain-containing protein [Limosilactobacillus fermentum]PJE91649.1 LexA family transcriptional repressor [Limosilactobacillus fermentum]